MLDSSVEGLQSRIANMEAMLTQLLARIPEKDVESSMRSEPSRSASLPQPNGVEKSNDLPRRAFSRPSGHELMRMRA